MRVILAGYNLDTEVINELKAAQPDRQDVTPETLSASYARISRDPRSIDILRNAARQEVDKTRRSNKSIIFKMGHHSVAEHAVFNFDIIGASRLAMEEIEKFRLCSYTEKSQRYITLTNDFVVPEEIEQSSYRDEYIAVIKLQNAFYHKAYEKLKTYIFEKNKDLASDEKKHSLLDGWAKEDARYITSLATQAQVGHTLNARNLELLFRRFASHPLQEIQILGKNIYEQVKEIAPSIILFTEANDFDQKTYCDIAEYLKSVSVAKAQDSRSLDDKNTVDLVSYTDSPDDIIIAALMLKVRISDFRMARETATAMTLENKRNIIKEALKYMEFYDSALREFEYAVFTYETVVSAACFGQLKRHRLTSQVAQPYDPLLGVTVPDSIKAVGLAIEFGEVIEKTNELYYKMKRDLPVACQYVLTNAHRRKVLVGTNMRELYHISRLREDHHAQWDINDLSAKMVQAAREVAPASTLLICGKDKYSQVYQEVYGRLPKMSKIPESAAKPEK